MRKKSKIGKKIISSLKELIKELHINNGNLNKCKNIKISYMKGIDKNESDKKNK